MKWKQRDDIPKPILKALMGDRYDLDLQEHMEDLPPEIKNRFSHTISVTTLNRSARQRILFKRHADEVEVDPEERAHALLGRVIHTILQENKEPWQIAEERLGYVVDVTLPDGRPLQVYTHGAADIYDPTTETIWDYKTPKTGSLMYDKSDYHAQLNILAHLWRKRGKPVSSIFNAYLLLKDYDKRYIKEDNEYPRTRFPSAPVPMWDDAVAEQFMKDRIIAHFSNENRPDDELDFCSPAERWQSEPRYGVYKLEGDLPQKTAKHWSHSLTEAEEKVIELESEDWAKIVAKNNELVKPKPESVILLKKAQFTIKEVKSQPRYCNHCDGLRWCNQRQAELIAQSLVQHEPETIHLHEPEL